MRETAVVRRSISFVLAAVAFSCTTNGVPNPDAGEVRKTLQIEDDGETHYGVVTLGSKPVYTLRFRAKKKAEFIRISNCHRDEVFQTGGERSLTYVFKPNPTVERGSCVMLISFLDEKGAHEFGAIDFRDDDETMFANVACNGAIEGQVGASFCQAKSGTIQSLTFSSVTRVREGSGCEPATSKDAGNTWLYTMQPGLCVYVFRDDKGDFHKHTTFGYTEILPGE
jgi:hypothetical protein